MKHGIETISPIDNSVYVQREFASSENIDKVIELSRSVQMQWKARPLSERKELCSRAVDAFVANKTAIAEEICWQMGRPIRSAAGEVAGMEERSRTMIDLVDQGLAPVQLSEKEGFQRWIQREAIGIVFVVAPWNYPYLTAINAILPSILAGNTVISKHSARHHSVLNGSMKPFRPVAYPKVFFNIYTCHTRIQKGLSKGPLAK